MEDHHIRIERLEVVGHHEPRSIQVEDLMIREALEARQVARVRWAPVLPTRLAVVQEDLEDYFLRLTGEKE